MKQYISIILTLATLLGGGLLGYGRLQESQAQTKERIKEVEAVVKETNEKIHANDKIDIRQSVLIDNSLQSYERTMKIIERLEKKME